LKIGDYISLFSKQKWSLYALYILGLAAILPYTFYYVNNPDTFQYISLAQKISKGYFSLALNGYWSPLICWLISIPVFFGLDGIVSFKLVQILIGFFTIDAWLKLCSVVGFGSWYRRVLGLLIIPFVLDYAILNPTADLLFLTLVLYSLIILLNNQWMNGRGSSLRLAVLGALLYFAKAFGFPFFISLLVLNRLICYCPKGKKLLNKATLFVLLIFLVLSALWIVPLSLRYGHFTISEAVRFNMTKEVAPLPGKIMYLPVLNGPLLAPPDTQAISAWESPGEVLKLTSIKPLSSKADFSYYIQIIKRNIFSIWYTDFRNQFGFIFLLVLFCLFFFKNVKKVSINRKTTFLFFILLLFYGGYSLILVHLRYVWICTLIMILLTAWMWENLSNKSQWNQQYFKYVFVMFLLLAVKRPIKEILFTQDSDIPLLWIGKGISHPFETMRIHYLSETFILKAIGDLKKIPEYNGRIASLNSSDGLRHIYSSSLFIANELDLSYYGPINASLSMEQMKEQLRAFDISIFLVWNHDNWLAKDQPWVKTLYFDPNLGLTVYGLF